MRILYSAGNRVGANSQMSRFLGHLDEKHEVKVAAYIRSSESAPHVDWTLDALHYQKPPSTDDAIVRLFGYRGVPFVNVDNTKIFLQEAEEFEPDIVIVDGEPIAAHIAKKINAKLWYCSPIHLFDGIEWEKGQLRYTAHLAGLRRLLRYFPDPDKILIYSPFGDIRFRPYLKSGYDWLVPYYHSLGVKMFPSMAITSGMAIVNDIDRISELSKILNCVSSFNLKLFSPFNEKYSNIETASIRDKRQYEDALTFTKWMFTTGETSHIADAFYSLKDICIAPSLKDYEALLNAILCRCYGIGVDIAQVEFQGKFALDTIEQSFNNKKLKKNYLSKQDRLLLHERLEEDAAHSV